MSKLVIVLYTVRPSVMDTILTVNQRAERKLSNSSIYFVQGIKWNNYPPSPKAMVKARRSKNASFWHNGGRDGSDVPFIYSKIASDHANTGADEALLSYKNACYT